MALLTEVEIIAAKRIIAYQIEEVMKLNHLTKTMMAKKMSTSRASLDRLLDPDNMSVTLYTLAKAANALGKKIQLSLADVETD